jgi:integrase
MAVGMRQRHGRRCKGGRCLCSWEAFVYIRRDRKKVRKTFATQAAARAWRHEASVAARRQVLRVPTAITVDQAAKDWMLGARTGVIRTRGGDCYKPATLRAYETAMRLRVKPVLGSKRLSAVTRPDLQDLVDRLVGDGLNASTVSVTLMSLSVVYRRAFSRDEIAVNPMIGLEMPAIRSNRDRVAAPQECAELLAALPARDRALWATAMYAGLRRGELTALRIEDIDLGRGVINVRRGWDTLEGEITTKSGRERKVPIAATLRDYLDEHLLALGWSEGLVFGLREDAPFNGTPLMARAERSWRAVGLQRITLHECRHTFASLMIEAGVNAKALSTYMGHANISFTFDRYGHLMPGNEDEAAGMLDDYLDRSVPVPPSRASAKPARRSRRTLSSARK